VQNLKMLGYCGREEIDYYKLLYHYKPPGQ
jgi:hypothetical protein